MAASALKTPPNTSHLLRFITLPQSRPAVAILLSQTKTFLAKPKEQPGTPLELAPTVPVDTPQRLPEARQSGLWIDYLQLLIAFKS
jgi:hypothetical protein